MTELIPTPPLIDALGNMSVHGRSGIYLPWKAYTDTTLATQIDISGSSLFFEVDALLRQQLVTDPNDAKGLLLSIPSLETAGLPANITAVGYIVRDETSAVPIIRAQGQLRIYGWGTTPP